MFNFHFFVNSLNPSAIDFLFSFIVKVKVLVIQSCPTLYDPMDCSLPGSSVHGILQARILERVAMPFSRRSSQPRDQTHGSFVSCIGRRVLYHGAPWEAPLLTAE